MKIFRTIKRVISQFFETEFWYRWRIVSKPNAEIKRRAFENLNDTWNGDFSILNMVDDKVTHMLHNLRKYGNCADCYLLPSDIVSKGTKDDLKFTWKRIIEDEINSKFFKWKIWIGNIDVDKSESDSGNKLFYLEKEGDFWYIVSYTEKEIPFESIPKNKRTKTFDGFKNGEILTSWAKEFKLVNRTVLSKITNIFDYELIQTTIDNFKIPFNILNSGIFTVTCIHIEPEDKKFISSELYKAAQGLKPNLRSLWEFRRRIREFRDLDIDNLYDFENYTKEDYVAASKEFEEKRRVMAHELVDFWLEHAYDWWD